MTLVYRPDPLLERQFTRPRDYKIQAPDDVPIGSEEIPAGTDITGSWISATSTAVAGVDGSGPWIDDGSSSSYAGVDGVGTWVVDS